LLGRDWIEIAVRVDPDHGNSSLEWLVVAVTAVAAITCSVLASLVWRRAQKAMKLDLLLSLPKIGQVKAHQILSHARIAPTKTLAGLTGRQRGELLTLIQH
jgi:hypothetical protein